METDTRIFEHDIWFSPHAEDEMRRAGMFDDEWDCSPPPPQAGMRPGTKMACRFKSLRGQRYRATIILKIPREPAPPEQKGEA